MDSGIGSFGSSGVTPAAPVLAVNDRGAQPKPVARTREPLASQAPFQSERKIELDAATQSLVYRTIDVTSGVVIRQTPDETRLRLRAYIDGLAEQTKPLVERVA